jgi:hypothetical protein
VLFACVKICRFVGVAPRALSNPFFHCFCFLPISGVRFVYALVLHSRSPWPCCANAVVFLFFVRTAGVFASFFPSVQFGLSCQRCVELLSTRQVSCFLGEEAFICTAQHHRQLVSVDFSFLSRLLSTKKQFYMTTQQLAWSIFRVS